MKTTVASPGNTDWDSVDGSIMVNRLGHSDQNLIASMWAFEHNSDIYVATQQDYGRIALHIFDPSTSAWTTRDEHTGNLDYYRFISTSNVCVSLSVRANGDVVIIYRNRIAGAGVRCIRRVGSTWTDITVNTTHHNTLICTPPDSTNRITFVIFNAGTDDTDTISFSSGNALGTEVAVDNSSTNISTAEGALGSAVIISNEIYAPYLDADESIGIGNWTSADNPSGDVTLASATTNIVATESNSPIKFGLVANGTDLHVFYINSTDDDIWHSEDVGSGWGATDTNEITGTGVISQLSVAKLTTDIGIIYDDAGTAKFAVYALAAATTSLPIFKPFNYNNFLVR